MNGMIRSHRAQGAVALRLAREYRAVNLPRSAAWCMDRARAHYASAAAYVLADRPATLADPCCGCADCERSDGPFTPCRCGRA